MRPKFHKRGEDSEAMSYMFIMDQVNEFLDTDFDAQDLKRLLKMEGDTFVEDIMQSGIDEAIKNGDLPRNFFLEEEEEDELFHDVMFAIKTRIKKGHLPRGRGR